MRILSKALIIGLLLVLTVGLSAYAIAAYTMTSNSITLNVVPASTPEATPTPAASLSPQATLTLRWDVFGGVPAGSNTIGDNEAVTLVAYVSDKIAGITVNFYEGTTGGTHLGSAVTGSDGAAVLRIGELNAGTHNFIATAEHP